jgi:hypothetical protein
MFLAKFRMPLYNRFLKNRRFLNSVSDKEIKKTKDVSVINDKWWEHEYMPIMTMVGTGIGTCIGAYNGYQDSKKDTYGQCLFTTVCFGWAGGGVGYVSALFCPVTVPIVIATTIARQIDPVLEPEKKTSGDQDYTVYRP